MYSWHIEIVNKYIRIMLIIYTLNSTRTRNESGLSFLRRSEFFVSAKKCLFSFCVPMSGLGTKACPARLVVSSFCLSHWPVHVVRAI